MTKSELIEQISELLKLPNGKAEQIVNCVFDSMVRALQDGDGIEIRGFGSFTVREYKSYEGRNPRTGETVHVAPKRLPFFKVGKDLRERVNEAWKERDEAAARLVAGASEPAASTPPPAFIAPEPPVSPAPAEPAPVLPTTATVTPPAPFQPPAAESTPMASPAPAAPAAPEPAESAQEPEIATPSVASPIPSPGSGSGWD